MQREHPMLTVEALRAKPALVERALKALNSEEFPMRLKIPLKVLLERDELSPSFVVGRLQGLLKIGERIWKEERQEEFQAKIEHRSAIERREVLKSKLLQKELSEDDREKIATMVALFERHLKCDRGSDPAQDEKDVTMTPKEFLTWTGMFISKPYVPVFSPAPRTQDAPDASAAAV